VSETKILREILMRLSHSSRRLFRMHVGVYRALHSDDIIRIGLPGMSDLCGVQSVLVTPEMVGTRIGVFVALEVKRKNGRPSTSQIDFVEMIRSLGGRAAIVRSVAEAEICCDATLAAKGVSHH
jgi:VRR-NUC domain-containing protein